MDEQIEKVDILRDTPIRLLGYANEVGESFRYVFPRLVKPSWAISLSYCLTDTIDKSYKEVQKNNGDLSQAPLAAIDTMIWQGLATEAIPGLVIHLIVKSTIFAKKNFKLSLFLHKWLPTAIAICSIPIIVRPIDHAVDSLMNKTVRNYFKSQ